MVMFRFIARVSLSSASWSLLLASSLYFVVYYHHIPIKTKPLAPKVQWSVIGLNKPQRQIESSVTCRCANHLSTAFCLQPIDPPAPKSSFLTAILLYLHTQNSRKNTSVTSSNVNRKISGTGSHL